MQRNTPLTTEEFIQKARVKHENKYDYSNSIYINKNTKLKIICPTHGEFLQFPYDHHRTGCGCPKCKSDKIGAISRYTRDQWIEKANQTHNNKYDYSSVEYKTQKIKVCIICPNHGEFWQLPSAHLFGYRCPKCQESKGEQKVREWLESKNIKYIPQMKFKDCKHIDLLRFDFYLPDYNTCIEYDGSQHFKPKSFGKTQSKELALANLKDIQLKDQIKNQYCIANNIKLIRIPYTKFPNIDLILKMSL